MKMLTLCVVNLAFLLSSCINDYQRDNPLDPLAIQNNYGQIIDERDNQRYLTIKINGQEWMAQNLNYGIFIEDGSSANLLQNGSQKFCYDNIEENCTSNGGLYQWHTAMGFDSSCNKKSCASLISKTNHQGICPMGWHIPKQKEWDDLALFLGGSDIAGSKMKKTMTSSEAWNNKDFNMGDLVRFSAIPVGYRSYFGQFYSQDSYAYFWEATENGNLYANQRNLNSSRKYLDRDTYLNYSKSYGFSIRCIHN
jgi:uncharacterized protein (TIGR02145 family)